MECQHIGPRGREAVVAMALRGSRGEFSRSVNLADHRRGRGNTVRRVGVLVALIGLLITTGCGGRGAGEEGPAPPPPDLSGQRVMLLPVRAPAPGQLDAELAYWLGDRAPSVDWIPPAELQRAADRAPAWQLQLDALPRPIAEVGAGEKRARDPLYGALRQLGAVTDASYAVVPVSVGESETEAGVQLAIAVAVMDIRGGRVLWMHTARGERNPDRGVAVASVAETVARLLVP